MRTLLVTEMELVTQQLESVLAARRLRVPTATLPLQPHLQRSLQHHLQHLPQLNLQHHLQLIQQRNLQHRLLRLRLRHPQQIRHQIH